MIETLKRILSIPAIMFLLLRILVSIIIGSEKHLKDLEEE